MLASQDPLSLVALLVGRDNAIFMYIMVAVMIFNKRQEIARAWTELLTPKYNVVQFSGIITRRVGGGSAYSTFEDDMRAVVHYICKNLTPEQLNTMQTGEVLTGLNDDSTISTPPLPVNTAKGIKIAPDIEMLLYTKTKQATSEKRIIGPGGGEHHDHEEKEVSLLLRTKGSIELLTEFVKKAEKEHEAYLEQKSYRPRIVKPIPDDRRGGVALPLETTKTFDNLFFEGKEVLIQRLDSFKNKDKYIKMGLPHTLGLLFHGQPGTGKTSCIKAIAQYMKMSIILVPMNKIKSRSHLEELFLEKYVGGEKIPQDKRIYVFEEIDCNGWTDIIKPRSNGSGTTVTPVVNAQPQTIILGTGGKIKTEEDDEEKLSLGALLEMLDGIIELNGRIIIMTTNKPEALDPALRRPGRIDMELEFKRLRRQHIAAIYQRWFGRAMKEATMNRLPDYKWSQADIGQLLFKYENNAGGFIEELLRE